MAGAVEACLGFPRKKKAAEKSRQRRRRRHDWEAEKKFVENEINNN